MFNRLPSRRTPTAAEWLRSPSGPFRGVGGHENGWTKHLRRSSKPKVSGRGWKHAHRGGARAGRETPRRELSPELRRERAAPRSDTAARTAGQWRPVESGAPQSPIQPVLVMPFQDESSAGATADVPSGNRMSRLSRSRSRAGRALPTCRWQGRSAGAFSGGLESGEARVTSSALRRPRATSSAPACAGTAPRLGDALGTHMAPGIHQPLPFEESSGSRGFSRSP